MEPNDWRLCGQENYLKGADLQWKEYIPDSGGSDHAHCEFCWHKFMAQPNAADCSDHGYCTPDGAYWVCEACFRDFKKMFDWHER